MEDYLQVGVITQTHGIRGEVKVFPTTDDATRFKKLKEVYLEAGKEKKLLYVESCKFFKQFVILKFKGMDKIEDVERLRQCPLLVDREHAVKLKPNEYFIADLIGLDCVDENGQKFGTVKDIMQTGANDVYEIEMNDKRELLLPAIKDCILEVNINEGYVKIHILDGALD